MKHLRAIDIQKNECTGCRCCSNVCPKSAIRFENDDCGFAYPVIDENLCIDCGICYSKCPQVYLKDKANTNFEHPLCFAFESKDPEIVRTSSSGGAFSTIANWVLKKGGVVCGVRYNYETKENEHIVINREKDLPILRTSKYIQSNTGSVYKEVKKALQRNKYVLFVGVGCQIGALRTFLGIDYPRLIAVDIVCHGVPSSYVFNKFVDSLDYKGRVSKINFREKKKYGWTPTMNIQYENGDEYYKPKWECEYYDAFLKGYACRLSCGNCHYNKLPRQGDLTFADFWDITKYDSRFIGTKGTSLVLFNNMKWINLIEVFQENARLFIPEDINVEKETNWNVFGSSKTNPGRDRFFRLLKKYDFKEAVNRTINRHFEIGLVGWWYGRNYGSFLTYYALNRWLIENNYDVLMLSWPYANKPFPPKRTDYIESLIDEYYDTSISRTFAEYPNVNRYVDAFIIGSDQMWNYWDQKGMGYYYFLDFVDDNHPRISYATSFGHTKYMAPEDMITHQKELLHKFNSISVRENDGIDICKQYFDIDAVRTIDPVFLIDQHYYEELINKNPIKVDNKYLFCYILTPTKEKGEVLKKISQRLGLELIIALDGQTNVEENREKLGIENVQLNLNVSQWLSFIKNADYVVTDSFHGVCFSILFRKEFACLVNKQRGKSRFDTLFGLLGLEDRAFDELDDLLDSDLSKVINYAPVFDKIDNDVEFSSKWLKRELDKMLK